VEHDFFELWNNNQKLLLQRNQLLKTGRIKTIQKAEQKAWDLPFAQANEEVRRRRAPCVAEVQQAVNAHLGLFPAFEGISIHLKFSGGWPADKCLIDILESEYQTDVKKGFTGKGGHRADLFITLEDGRPAKEILSRGQKKILAMVMRLAQAQLVKASTSHSPVLLVDDLFAELDEENTRVVCSLLEGLDAQVFLSALEKPKVNYGSFFKQSSKVFHVEHGVLKEL
jgi:DNA replication and repair protein RecF